MRNQDLETTTVALLADEIDFSFMATGYEGDNTKSQSNASFVAIEFATGLVELLKNAFSFVYRDSGAVIFDFKHAIARYGECPQHDPFVWSGVFVGVFQKVSDSGEYGCAIDKDR